MFVILIILALNEQKISPIYWEKNERQGRRTSVSLPVRADDFAVIGLLLYRLIGGVDVKEGSLNTQEIFQDQNLHSKDFATRFLQDGIQSST